MVGRQSSNVTPEFAGTMHTIGFDPGPGPLDEAIELLDVDGEVRT